MAYERYEDDNFRTDDESLEFIKESIGDLQEKLKKLAETTEDSASGIRMDVGQSRRELVHMRSSLQRLQSRFDNQLTVLVLGNIASGVGVAAIVLAATQGFR